ncbi:MAG: CapA family protein [Candidatus Saccharimonadales bacterium]
MLRIEKEKKRRVRSGVLMGALVALVLGAGAIYGYDNLVLRAETTGVQSASQVKPAAKPTSLESRMLVMGDVYWGRYINDWSMKSELTYAYPFSRLSEFERDTYDAWINDMECPITNNPKVSSAVEDSTLQFDCDPAYLPEAKKWFTVMTLANNHTDNQGAEGLVETRQHLDEHGIQYFGTYDPDDDSHICDVIALPARVTMSDRSEKQIKLPMVWCGYHGVFKTPSAESVQVMSQYAKRFNIVAMPHSGAEYKPEPDTIKTDFYRSLIDGGADVVIGDHPHWIQSSEAYKGKLIMYSLGNFIFDQQYNREVTRSAVLSMTVSLDASDAPDLAQWMALGERCATYQDTCLQMATDQELAKLPLKYHFAVLGSDNSGKLVHRASAEQLADIKLRLRWQQTISGLSGNNSGE